MHRTNSHRRGRLAGLLALALGVAALLAIPVVSAAQDGRGSDDGRRDDHGHHGKRHHDRHHGEREVAGTVASFDAASGRLTIETRGGDTLSGLVDSRTKIKCEDFGEAQRHNGRGEAEPGDDNGGDNSGPGSSGSDNSAPGSGGSEDSSGPSGSGPSGHDDNGTGANCTTAALVPGALVTEADLEIEHGSARFDEVELAS
jgi:hypothetical protein